MAEDIIATLHAMHVLEPNKKGSARVVINKASVKTWAEKWHVDLKRGPVDPDAFVLRERTRSVSEES